ncbi:MAG: hypothetical protein AB1644_09620 [Candidatus Zixiibacteriota bacterium]
MSFFKGGTDLPSPADALPEDEAAVLDRVAFKVVDKGWTVPAILFLESVKPLNFIGSQAMVFFEPIIQSIFNLRDYDTFRCALEKRQSLEIMIQRIEAYDSVSLAREKRIKKFFKEEKKKWKWYQRWLGVFTPRVVIPDSVLNPPLDSSANDKKEDGPSGRPA